MCATSIRPEKTDKGYRIGPDSTSFGRSVYLVNPVDRDWTKHRYVLAFGAYGWTRLMVWANSLDDALEECGAWIVDHAPGLLADEQVAEAYREAIEEGLSEEEAREQAETDCLPLDGGHYLLSYECGVALEDPTRDELDAYLYPPGITWER